MVRKPYNEELNKQSEFIYSIFANQFKTLTPEFDPESKKRGAKKQPDYRLWYEGQIVARAELERKRVWPEFDFPEEWDSVQFPSRKGRFANWDVPVFMVMLNNDGTNGLIVEAKTMIESPLVKVGRARAGRYVTFGEEFYQVPLAAVQFRLDKFEDYILSKLGIQA